MDSLGRDLSQPDCSRDPTEEAVLTPACGVCGGGGGDAERRGRSSPTRGQPASRRRF
jgi:hypothetical protein